MFLIAQYSGFRSDGLIVRTLNRSNSFRIQGASIKTLEIEWRSDNRMIFHRDNNSSYNRGQCRSSLPNPETMPRPNGVGDFGRW